MRTLLHARVNVFAETAGDARVRRDALLFALLILAVIAAPYLLTLLWLLSGAAVGLIVSFMSLVALVGQYALAFAGGAYVLKLVCRV